MDYSRIIFFNRNARFSCFLINCFHALRWNVRLANGIQDLLFIFLLLQSGIKTFFLKIQSFALCNLK